MRIERASRVRRRRDLNPRSPQRGLHLSRVVHSAGLCDVSKHSRERCNHHTGGLRHSRPDAHPRVARPVALGPPKWGHVGVVGAYPTAYHHRDAAITFRGSSPSSRHSTRRRSPCGPGAPDRVAPGGERLPPGARPTTAPPFLCSGAGALLTFGRAHGYGPAHESDTVPPSSAVTGARATECRGCSAAVCRFRGRGQGRGPEGGKQATVRPRLSTRTPWSRSAGRRTGPRARRWSRASPRGCAAQRTTALPGSRGSRGPRASAQRSAASDWSASG